MVLVLLIGVGVLAFQPGDPAATERPSSRRAGEQNDVPGGAPEENDVEPEPELPPPEPINTEFQGLTTFRGNATRTYYGEGPIPTDPEVLWKYPRSGGLCSESTDQHGTRLWCGTGWTGQPNVVETDKGTEVRFGAYDGGVHFLDAKTGKEVKNTFFTGDLIKGSVTSDPDGYPLLYTGSRDDYFHVLALDRGKTPRELWRLGADTAPNPVWNNDWDGSALIVDDYLLEGGENSWFYVVKLNRDYDADGNVTVDPEIKVMVPGFDEQLFAELGDDNVSIESSVAFHDGVAYFANSGGLVQGWDISDVLNGGKRYRRVFRFWTGDDTDASVVVDREGYLYVASEHERLNARAAQVGQLMKLDPRRKKKPVVWSIAIRSDGGAGGLWATPALYGNAVYATTNSGRLLAVTKGHGRIAWELQLHGPTWSSPIAVDDTLIVGDCGGELHAYDVHRPLKGPPKELWSVSLPGCIESTPALWKGRIYVGTRGGKFYAIGDRS
jgi:hypothetical protein